MFDKLRDLGFEIEFTSHAEAIILHDFPDLIGELESALEQTTIPITEIIGGGGGEAKVTQRLRRSLAAMEWIKHNFELKKIVDGVAKESISHEIDHVRRSPKGVFALEIEWNNKDPFFDRDLENFKRLHAEGAISLGGIVTVARRCNSKCASELRRSRSSATSGATPTSKNLMLVRPLDHSERKSMPMSGVAPISTKHGRASLRATSSAWRQPIGRNFKTAFIVASATRAHWCWSDCRLR